MSTLTLIIKQQYFDQIISGEKKIETREIRPKTASKYCDFDAEGVLIAPKEYDKIQFYVGYQPNRAAALVEVKGAEIIVYTDEETKELITFEENGEEYIESDIEYKLGEILNKQNC